MARDQHRIEHLNIIRMWTCICILCAVCVSRWFVKCSWRCALYICACVRVYACICVCACGSVDVWGCISMLCERTTQLLVWICIAAQYMCIWLKNWNIALTFCLHVHGGVNEYSWQMFWVIRSHALVWLCILFTWTQHGWILVFLRTRWWRACICTAQLMLNHSRAHACIVLYYIECSTWLLYL